MKDLAKVFMAAATSITASSVDWRNVAEWVQVILKTALLVVSLGYACWKWRQAVKHAREKAARLKSALNLFWLVWVCWLTGCSALIPSEHKEQVAVQSAGRLAAQQSADISKQSESPPVNLTVSGKENKVDLKLEGMKTKVETKATTDNDATGSDSATGNRSKSIPFFVKLIGCAVGGFLVLGLIWYIRKQYAAVDAAFVAGDQIVAGQISRWRDRAMTETDAGKLAVYNNEIANLERERGKFGKK